MINNHQQHRNRTHTFSYSESIWTEMIEMASDNIKNKNKKKKKNKKKNKKKEKRKIQKLV